MKVRQSQNNIPRNVIILALGITVLLGVFRLILFLVLVWVAALAFIIIYQYKLPTTTTANFVCLECATVHQQTHCPKCGSNLKKFYSRSNSYGIWFPSFFASFPNCL